jgi:hypothetical protein
LRPNESHGIPPRAAAVVPLADAIVAFVTTMRTDLPPNSWIALS